MSEYENAIEIKGITKKYDGFTLNNVSFDVPKGSIMGFIGQNGAGKSTTIRSLLNIIPVDGGEIRILGLDHLKNEKEIKERIAVVFDELPFHDVFNAKDMSRIFEGIYPKWNRNEYMRYLDRFQLPRKKKIGEFSKGMKMKLQIACALSHEAELLVMDEPTNHLDIGYQLHLMDTLRRQKEELGLTIFTSVHDIDLAAAYCDSIIVMKDGDIITSGSPETILTTDLIRQVFNVDTEITKDTQSSRMRVRYLRYNPIKR